MQSNWWLLTTKLTTKGQFPLAIEVIRVDKLEVSAGIQKWVELQYITVCHTLLQHLHLCHSLPPTFLSLGMFDSLLIHYSLYPLPHYISLIIGQTQHRFVEVVVNWVIENRKAGEWWDWFLFLTDSWFLSPLRAYIDFLVDLLSPYNTQRRRQGILAP